jgi:hypothetical protein
MPFFAQKRAIYGNFWAKSDNFIKTKKGYLNHPDIPFVVNYVNLFFYSFYVLTGFCIYPYQLSFIYKQRNVNSGTCFNSCRL